MSRLRALAHFLWEFVIGDDWRIAAGVAVALGLTALIAGTDIPAWWVLPLAVALILCLSVWDFARGERDRGSPTASHNQT
jgi:hypothetical protein